MQGGQGIINQVQNKLQSTYAIAGMTQVERHPQTAPGGTWLENKGVDLTPMPRASGSGDAMTDGRMLKQMVCAGTGVMEHYFGDGANANLATATAMELPMLKMFESYQAFWQDVYRNVFAIARDADPKDPEQRKALDITLPPILLDDLRKIGQFIGAVYEVFPQIAVPSVFRSLLNSLNVSNVDEVVEEAENKLGELALADQQTKVHQLAMAKAKASTNGPTDPDVNQVDGGEPGVADQADGITTNPEGGYGTTEAAKATRAHTRALNRLAQAMEEAAR